jgi:hypothetical protein
MILTDVIVEYIFTNLGMMDQRKNSLISSKLLIDQKITFEDEQQYDIYACETIISQAKIMMVGTFITNEEDNTKDMVAIIKIENCPTYGCYATLDKTIVNNGLIAFTLKENTWVKANVFMQATFLAGMEQLRDVANPFDVCQITKDIYQDLVSFLTYQDTQTNEG